MARKTFISYKYSEAVNLRDKIIDKLGNDAIYYKGETSDSPCLKDIKTETIKEKLKNMMYDTSVTIVILSPNMRQSEWISWEIEYTLKNITRNNRTSHTNGIVAVIMKVDGSYDWFKYTKCNYHNEKTISYKMEKICDIIAQNHFNSEPPKWHCNNCKTYDWLNGSYITFIEEEEFLKKVEDYIENAYQKSENDGKGYKLCKEIK